MEKSDLSHWDLIDHFLPEEVSALIFGNDPSWVKNPSDKRFTVVVDRMASDFDLSISSFLRLIKCKSFDQERFPPEGGLMSLELKRKYQLAKMMSMNKEEFANEEDILNSMKNWAQIAEEQFHQVYFSRVEICQWLNENKISSKYNFSLDRTSVNYAPYFDPDNDDYPELLHIAVRAWEEARKESDGTPKKRISKFVEDRYPHVSEGARDAIALIANWQKSGGRPPKTGG